MSPHVRSSITVIITIYIFNQIYWKFRKICENLIFANSVKDIYFILSSEIDAYQKQINVISSTSEIIGYQSAFITYLRQILP